MVFSDLSGYTALNERLDPEEVERIMSRIKAESVRIVEGHGGIVNQFVGDEVLALFGIPTAHEDDPVRAVRAARELHEMVRGLSPEVEDSIGRPIRLHTGINTGLIVTNVRDQRDGTFGITGDTVNTGARLKALAADDAILLSPETRRLVADFFETEALQPAGLRGKVETLSPYRVAGEKQVATRFEAAQQRGFTPYTGRQRERATLQACLEKTVAGQGQFVTVMGEAGLGKSRLVYEFRHGIDREEVTVLEGRCQSYGTATPYLPFLDALRHALQLREEDTPTELHEKAVANIRSIDPALEPYLPHYLHLLSIPSEAFPLPADLQGEELRWAFEEVLAAGFTLSARHKPLVLILEDWHWADEASDSALRHLIELMPGEPLQVIVLYRPEEYEPSWGLPRHLTPLHVAPLEMADTERMICSLLGADDLPEGLVARAHERTGGNAFFNEEMGLSLLEAGTVTVKNRRAALSQSLDEVDLPNTVHAVIRSRLDRLDHDSEEALRLASVIGREFARRILERVASAQSQLNRSLEVLRTKQLIQQTRLVPEVAYRFNHVLTQAVVYETLLLNQRKELHALVGQAIEDLYADRLEEHYEALAHHFSNSSQSEKAIHYLELAGDKAEGYFALENARQYFRQAIKVLDEFQSGTDQQKSKRIDLTVKWASIPFLFPYPENLDVLEISLQFSEELRDEYRAAAITAWLGKMHYMAGNITRAMSMLEQCARMADSLNDQELQVLSYDNMGRASLISGEYSRGIEYLNKGIALMKDWDQQGEALLAPCHLAGLYAAMGRFPEAYSLLLPAWKSAKEDGNPAIVGMTTYLYSRLNLYQGNWREAAGAVKQSISYGDFSNLRISTWAKANQSIAIFYEGDREQGIALLKEAIELFEADQPSWGFSYYYSHLGEMCALAGFGREAKTYSQKALSYREIGQLQGETVAHRALAITEARAKRPSWSKVAQHMETSLRLAKERGGRPDLAITCYRYAELLCEKRDLEQAREYLNQATDLFTEMEMTWWLEQAGRLEQSLAGS